MLNKIQCVLAFILLLQLEYSHQIKRCPNQLEGYYPECNSTKENYGYDWNQAKYVPICPSISVGEFPDCHCRHGPKYDQGTNTCPHPECPTNTLAKSLYPNCNCFGKNKEYNAYLNECVLVCPEDSSGRYPDCKCDDDVSGFNKERFKCDRCPSDTTADSIYPNCKCKNANAAYDEYMNKCQYCGEGAFGKYPNCNCTNGNSYRSYDAHPCLSCPNGNGVYPNCTCEHNMQFDGRRCGECPIDSQGIYPNCVCDGNGTYEKGEYDDKCITCPDNSHGKYPNCVCADPFYYDATENACIDCPSFISRGVYPNCTCLNRNAAFIPVWMECRECPVNSTGEFPICKCEQENYIFSAYINKCYIDCGSDAIGLYPDCQCDVDASQKYLVYYDKKSKTCKNFAYSGRPCPPDSVGRSPYCHCFNYNVFEIYAWGCFTTYAYGDRVQECPNSKQKWPQCDLPVDPKIKLVHFN